MDWGKTGHRVIGEIAQKNLTTKSLEALDALLDGKSLAFVSTFADEIRSDKKYDYLAPWHYVNIPSDKCYQDLPPKPEGDIIYAINHCIQGLKNHRTTKDDKAFYLKLLVHFVGDIHQPLHVGRAEDRGGNDISIFWFGEKTNLHTLWDSQLIDHYEMSYTELSAHLPKMGKEQKIQLQNTAVVDWAHESQKYAAKIYREVPPKSKLEYVYHYQNFDLVRQRLLVAGLRLAAILNSIFDPTTP